MKGTAKSKVVTSGRLTGAVRGQLSRRRGTPDPGPACPEPAYSLYSTSTDSEEQVSSLHKGLDRCAALLTNILQADKAVLTLQEELSAAQSRLQEDLTELRKALRDTQSRLTDTEAENALIQTDLEATSSRLLDSEREKSELASLAQQRLEDIGNLNRILQGHDSSNRPPVVDGSVSDTEQHFNQHRPTPAEPPTDRITQFLMSLGQLEPSPPEHVRVAAERKQKTLRDRLAQPEVRPGDSARHQGAHLAPSHCHQEGQSCVEQRRRLSRWDGDSVVSDWSTRSGSSFDTRDEAAFRDGLAALDASIASLQKTIQLDLGR